MKCRPALSCEPRPIATEHNEVSTLKPRFSEVLCKGRILTTDAAQSYHDFGRLVQRVGGDVVVFIKDNTPATRADLALFFEDAEADRRTWQSYVQVEKGHGRLERRQIITSPDLGDYLARDWGEVGQVFREAPGTHHQRPVQCRSRLWLDEPFTQALFCPGAALVNPPPLAAGCHPGRGSLCSSLPARGPDACGAQHGRALLDGCPSRCECSLGKSDASPLILTRRLPGCFDLDVDF
jgi:hypothetical protein